MQELLKYMNVIDREISRAVRILCMISMAVIFILFLANVFVRFVPIYNFTTTDEWITLFLIWTIFFGAQELVKTKSHFMVDVITDKLKGTTYGKIFRIISTSISIIMFAAICYYGIILVDRSQATLQTIPYMKQSYLYACIPISAFFMMIYSIRDFVEALTIPAANQ